MATPITEINHPVRSSSWNKPPSLEELNTLPSFKPLDKSKGSRHSWSPEEDELVLECLKLPEVHHPKNKRIQWEIVKEMLTEKGLSYGTTQQLRCRVQRLTIKKTPLTKFKSSVPNTLEAEVDSNVANVSADPPSTSSAPIDSIEDCDVNNESSVSAPRPDGVSDIFYENVQRHGLSLQRLTFQELANSIIASSSYMG